MDGSASLPAAPAAIAVPLRPAARGRMVRAALRNPPLVIGLIILLTVILAALFAPVLFPGDPQDMVADPTLWPGQDPQYPLGTDSLGRDVAAGLAYGARVSLLMGLAAAVIGLVIGVAVGATGGYFGAGSTMSWCG